MTIKDILICPLRGDKLLLANEKNRIGNIAARAGFVSPAGPQGG